MSAVAVSLHRWMGRRLFALEKKIAASGMDLRLPDVPGGPRGCASGSGWYSNMTALDYRVLRELRSLFRRHSITPLSVSNVSGLWSASYGRHGLEFLEVVHDDQNHALVAWKVTGDDNVPVGEWTWRVKSLEPDKLEPGNFRAQVQIAEDNFNPNNLNKQKKIITNKNCKKYFIYFIYKL